MPRQRGTRKRIQGAASQDPVELYERLVAELERGDAEELGETVSEQENLPTQDDFDLRDKEGDFNLKEAGRRALKWIIYTMGGLACVSIATVVFFAIWIAYVFVSLKLQTEAGSDFLMQAGFIGGSVGAITLVLQQAISRVLR